MIKEKDLTENMKNSKKKKSLVIGEDKSSRCCSIVWGKSAVVCTRLAARS